ncbi:MAG: endonuclease V, partial [Candidatus Methanomethyliaceae archaeon]
RGEWSHVLADEEIIGVVLRTRPYRKPLFISPGHLIDFEDSIRVVLNCCRKFRIPEPLRRSHMVSRDIKGKLVSVKNTNGI